MEEQRAPYLVTGYYDRLGRPIWDLFEWARLFEMGYSYRCVAVTRWNQGGKSYRVSTVWLGLDHGWGGGRPLIFETMIFTSDEAIDTWCDRYSTEDEARAGHNAVVSLLKATVSVQLAMAE